MNTAVMLVLIWFPVAIESGYATQTQVTTPALYFDSFEACESVIPGIRGQVLELNPKAQVSATCYEEAADPRG